MHGVDLDEFTTLISLKYLLQICFHCSPKFKSILYKNHCYGNGGYHFECQNLFSTIISLVLSFYYETNVISCIRRDFIQIQGIYLNIFQTLTRKDKTVQGMNQLPHFEIGLLSPLTLHICFQENMRDIACEHSLGHQTGTGSSNDFFITFSLSFI